MKIYTKTGDNGWTVLRSGSKLLKSEPIFDILGTLDELNVYLGLYQIKSDHKLKKFFLALQADIFEIGAYVSGGAVKKHFIPNLKRRTVKMENLIDTYTKELPPLKSFILPGGSTNAGFLHLGRVTCRRLERVCVGFFAGKNRKAAQRHTLIYLNRLSDFLFVMALKANAEQNVKETVWNGAC